MKKWIWVASLGLVAIAFKLILAATTIEPSVGLYWYITSDPTAGGGVCAPQFQLAVRTDVPSLYAKTGAACTAWTALSGTPAGGVTGTGTNLSVALWNSGTSIGNANITQGAIAPGDITFGTGRSNQLTVNNINTTSVFNNDTNGSLALSSNGSGTINLTGLLNATGEANTGSIQWNATQTSTVTGVQDNFVINIGTSGTTILRWSGTSAVTFDGFKCGGADCASGDNGRVLIVINASTSSVNLAFARDAAGSVAGNRIYTESGGSSITIGNGSSATNNAAIFIYDGTSTRWRNVAYQSNVISQAETFTSTLGATNAVTVSGASGSLTVSGSGGTTLSGGNLLFSSATGHISTVGATTPTLTSCGSSPSPTINGSDVAGRYTTGGTATTCTITFAATYTNPPSCIVHAEGTATQPTYTVSATAITVSVDIAATVYDYHCIKVQ